MPIKKGRNIIIFLIGLFSCVYIPTASASKPTPWLFLLLDSINPPSNLMISNTDSSSVTLNWIDASNNEIGFSIYMASSQFGNYSYVESVSAGTTSYIVSGLAPSTTYWFKVTSYNSDGESDFSNIVSATTAADIFSIGGTLTGLISGALTLQNNQADNLVLNNNGSFIFSNQMEFGDDYNITVYQQPAGQICSVSNGSGTVTDDISNIYVLCTADTVTVSLAGTISSAVNILIDGDINDPNATFKRNDSFLTAQYIPNLVTLNGFASKTGTYIPGDNFWLTGDEYDVYSVHLNVNQLILLQVVDYDGADTYQGDIDMYLYDSELNLVDYSVSVGQFEYLNSIEDDDYYVVVKAYSGISKYVLNIGLNVSNSSFLKTKGGNFAVNEAVAKFKPTASLNGLSIADKNYTVSLKHRDTNRSTLVNFNPLANRPLQGAASTDNGINKHPFLKVLFAINPNSVAKYKTLQNIKSLRNQNGVEFAEPNYIYQALQMPNDSYYSYQWHYPVISLPQAWDITTGEKENGDVIVAIVDTGVFLAHPDLQGQLVAGYDFISSPAISLDGDGIDPNPDDPGDMNYNGSSSWHGTHVSGTVAAKTNNNLGVAGVSWQAKLMPIRALGNGGGTVYDIDQGVRYAAGLPNDSGTFPPQKADIINLSLGGSGYSQTSQDTFLSARAAGVIIVAAAGNDNTSQFFYPASYDGVISVSAIDYAGNRAPYSNYGARIDVAAPGGDVTKDLNNDGYGDGVFSTLVDAQGNSRVGIYNYYQGTSMASPHVAGVFALMKAVFPQLDPEDLEILLQNGDLTDDAGTIGRDDIYGYGIIDALKAVQEAKQLDQGGEIPSVIISNPAEISLNSGVDEAVLTLTKTGSEPISVNIVSDNAEWLNVSPISVDQAGLGQYGISVDRSGLSGGIYTALITFSLSQGDPTVVPVTMAVSYQSAGGDAGIVYIILIDGSLNTVGAVLATPLGNGQFSYTFDGVSPGNYIIVAGSDVDNDNFLCQYGESCGAYPSLDYFSNINITNLDIMNLNFTVDILSGFSSVVPQIYDQKTLGKHQVTYSRKPINSN